jgi:UDP-N-acetyl-D-mannosaminuronate dehydrogenase
MKDLSDDVTVSPAVDLARELARKGAIVHVLDSVAEAPPEFTRAAEIDAGCAWADALVLPIRQGNVNYDHIKDTVRAAVGRITLFDFRGVFEHDADVVHQAWYIRL